MSSTYNLHKQYVFPMFSYEQSWIIELLRNPLDTRKFRGGFIHTCSWCLFSRPYNAFLRRIANEQRITSKRATGVEWDSSKSNSLPFMLFPIATHVEICLDITVFSSSCSSFNRSIHAESAMASLMFFGSH
ncbi:hypothetical protein Tco_0304070 [Tanacetum coccineum]